MDVPNLRQFNPGKPVDVDDTDMLNTVAKEPKETVSATNDMKELVNATPDFGKLGAIGRTG